ncbi:MAG: rhodanese-like domain-containing protein [Bacteroidia bacterium]
MIKYVFILFPLLVSMAFSQSIDKAYDSYLKTLDLTDEVPRLEPEQVDSGTSWLFLDTRPEAEFVVSHIPGAKRIGYMPRLPYVLEGLDKDQPIIVYCTVGWRSGQVGAWLQGLGFTKVYNLYGGILAWSNAEKPLEAQAKPTNKVHTYSEEFSPWLKRGVAVY